MKINNTLRKRIRSIPIIYPLFVRTREYLDDIIHYMRNFIAKTFGLINAPEELHAFSPSSDGKHSILSDLTVLSANQTFPFLTTLIKTVANFETKIYSIDEFCMILKDRKDASAELKHKFDTYGSDKASMHNYYLVYSHILSNRNAITALMEIGLGTYDKNIVSHMGTLAKPGASLRAFRDFLPHAMVYGADFDKKILFEEERIKTFFVDQTNPDTLEQLNHSVPAKLDLIIDDGLHAPNANIATLTFALPKLKDGGWVVIEDIGEGAFPVWEIVSTILPTDMYKSYLIKTKWKYMFVCQKTSTVSENT